MQRARHGRRTQLPRRPTRRSRTRAPHIFVVGREVQLRRRQGHGPVRQVQDDPGGGPAAERGAVPALPARRLHRRRRARAGVNFYSAGNSTSSIYGNPPVITVGGTTGYQWKPFDDIADDDRDLDYRLIQVGVGSQLTERPARHARLRALRRDAAGRQHRVPGLQPARDGVGRSHEEQADRSRAATCCRAWSSACSTEYNFGDVRARLRRRVRARRSPPRRSPTSHNVPVGSLGFSRPLRRLEQPRDARFRPAAAEGLHEGAVLMSAPTRSPQSRCAGRRRGRHHREHRRGLHRAGPPLHAHGSGGDDHGDGSLLYPLRDDLAPGELDLRSLTARADPDGTMFEATFARPIRRPDKRAIDAGGGTLDRDRHARLLHLQHRHLHRHRSARRGPGAHDAPARTRRGSGAGQRLGARRLPHAATLPRAKPARRASRPPPPNASCARRRRGSTTPTSMRCA